MSLNGLPLHNIPVPPSKIANQDLKQIIKWLNINKLSLNIKKSKYILFSQKNITPVYNERLYINNVEIDRTKQIKFLGYIIDEKLSWKSHINYISLKVSKNIAIIKKLIKTINRDSLYNLYYSLIYPYLINGITVWGISGISNLSPLIILQKKVVRIFMKSGRRDHTLPLFKKLNILPFNSLYVYNMLVNIYKIRNELLPEIFTVNFKINRNITTRNTRQQDLYFIPKFRTQTMENTLIVQGPKIANKYKVLFQTHCSIGTFKRTVKKLLFSDLD